MHTYTVLIFFQTIIVLNRTSGRRETLFMYKCMILFMKPIEIVDIKQFVVDAVHSSFEKLKAIKMKIIDLKEKKWSVKISVDGKKVFDSQGSSNHEAKMDLQVKFLQFFFAYRKMCTLQNRSVFVWHSHSFVWNYYRIWMQ